MRSRVANRQPQRSADRRLAASTASSLDVVAPDDAQEVADILAEAAARGQAVAPVGGGTALGLGNLPERLDLVLSTERLRGIIDYEPTDLVLSVGAGARLRRRPGGPGRARPAPAARSPGRRRGDDRRADRHRAGGPLPLRRRHLRDLLIGIAVAHPERHGHQGRRHGRQERLRLRPAPPLPRLARHARRRSSPPTSRCCPRPGPKRRLLATFRHRPPMRSRPRSRCAASANRLAALEVARLRRSWRLAARIEGREATVATIADARRDEPWRRMRLVSTAPRAQPGGQPTSHAASSRDAERRESLVRCGVRPRDTAIARRRHLTALAEHRRRQCRTSPPHPGLAPSWRGSISAATGSPDALWPRLQAVLLGLADTATILAAPPDWKRGIDVWGRLPGRIRRDASPARRVRSHSARSIPAASPDFSSHSLGADVASAGGPVAWQWRLKRTRISCAWAGSRDRTSPRTTSCAPASTAACASRRARPTADRPGDVLAARPALADARGRRRAPRSARSALRRADVPVPQLPRLRGGLPVRRALRPAGRGVARPARAAPAPAALAARAAQRSASTGSSPTAAGCAVLVGMLRLYQRAA